MAADRAAARRRMYLLMMLRSVARRRSRVLIAILAIAIGATTLTGLVTIFTDIPRQMGRELRSYGANLVVLPQGRASIADTTLARLDAEVPAGALLGRAGYRYETIRINSQPWTAAGADLDAVRAVRPYWQVTGEWPSPGEVLIGRDVADATGIGIGGSVALVVAGEDGKDDSTPAVVSGVLDTGDAEDGFVVISSADLAALVPGDRGYDVVEYSVTVDPDALADLAAGINAADGEVTAAPVKRLARSETTVLTTLSSLLLSVTLIVLALTMITVATTMMAVVAERRAEIGLKKALGAGERAIAADFLGEGLLLGFVGGLLGGVLGLAFAQVVSLRVFGRGVQTDWWFVPAAVAVSMLVTAVACLLPVRRAADIEPAVVLREE
jgi:putative ABC transport system permease protein